MTERIERIKQLQWEGRHHAARMALCGDMPLPYRDPGMPHAMRTALRMKLALEMETPYLFPGELIAFTRTVPNLPFVFGEDEWTRISEEHFIHEMGNVSNLSPDYGRVIASGLCAVRETLTDAPEHEAMRLTIDAVLDLTNRYAHAAREAGDDALADVRARVPPMVARTFR